MNTSSKVKTEESPTCVVCYEPFAKEESANVITLSCFHVFHRPCIIRWFNQPNPHGHRCPTCKQTPTVEIMQSLFPNRVYNPLIRHADLGRSPAQFFYSTYDPLVLAIGGWLASIYIEREREALIKNQSEEHRLLHGLTHTRGTDRTFPLSDGSLVPVSNVRPRVDEWSENFVNAQIPPRDNTPNQIVTFDEGHQNLDVREEIRHVPRADGGYYTRRQFGIVNREQYQGGPSADVSERLRTFIQNERNRRNANLIIIDEPIIMHEPSEELRVPRPDGGYYIRRQSDIVNREQYQGGPSADIVLLAFVIQGVALTYTLAILVYQEATRRQSGQGI